jgi:hypothetical protein
VRPTPSVLPPIELPVVPAQLPAAQTRRAAWLVGSRWSLAALVRDRGAALTDVAEWLNMARAQAELLRITLKDFPPLSPPGEAAPAGSNTVDHLIAEGQRLGRDLSTQFGPDHAALLEMAVKSNLLLVLYEPGSATSQALAEVVSQSRERAQLPNELSQSLLTAIAEKREAAEVRKAIFRLHDVVGRHLDDAAPR